MRKCSILLGVMAAVFVFTGCGKKTGTEGYAPASNISWTVTSSPGGGSDIYTRMIADIATKKELVGKSTFVITNKTDGSGEVGRNEVANTKGSNADNLLLTFNSGDLMPMVENTKNRAANFKIIAIMAVDKQLIFKGAETKYEDFTAAIAAAKSGEKIIIGGSKGDDIATYEALLAEIGVSKENMTYIIYDSTSDAITAILGGHIDFVISKPAASSEYVTAGSMIPVLALSTERFTGNLADAPTLSEIGEFNDVEVPVWRGVAGPAAMSDEAVAYWTDIMKQVSESEEWKTDYLEKNKLISNYMNSADATAYVTQYEKDHLASIGQ